jgi:hypothetical protein
VNAELLSQFDLTWALADLHLSALVEEDFSPASGWAPRLRGECPQWEPAPLCGTVRPDAAGVWRPDWSDTEPDPVPVPTIAWLTWHITWWWSTAVDRVTGETPRHRDGVMWPGDGAVAVSEIRALAARWRELLAQLGTEHVRTALWLNAELMKNIAEIGQLRLLRAAGG